MTLRLYNTLTRRKEDFVPLDPANVRMYVCGPTVYDYAHIGNARPVIVFDVLFRLLRHLYGAEHVKYVRNITDVDDKINARAKEEGVPISDLTARTTKQFHDDIAALGVLAPTEEPRATDNIPQMIELIGVLLQRGHAYEAAGEVLFDVSSMADYGALSNRNLDEQQAGARVAVEPHKRNPGDFVLWKQSSADEPGWESPWGRGRPGWHIECSAMSKRYLGEVFDIHGGGIDLIFPHHENEIAQSRCAHGTDVMANVWMHNGFLQVEGQKMSKSLGNFLTIHDLLKKWPGDVLRLQMLQTHYRVPIDWTESRCHLASDELEDWGQVLEGYWDLPQERSQISSELVEALSDDINTPETIAVLRKLFSDAKSGSMEKRLAFAEACRFIGFRQLGNPGFFRHGVSGTNVQQGALFESMEVATSLRAALANGVPTSVVSDIAKFFEGKEFTYRVEKGGYIDIVGKDYAFSRHVKTLIDDRLAARRAKNWAESDRIRDELASMGVVLEDNKDGTTSWEVKR